MTMLENNDRLKHVRLRVVEYNAEGMPTTCVLPRPEGLIPAYLYRNGCGCGVGWVDLFFVGYPLASNYDRPFGDYAASSYDRETLVVQQRGKFITRVWGVLGLDAYKPDKSFDLAVGKDGDAFKLRFCHAFRDACAEHYDLSKVRPLPSLPPTNASRANIPG